MLSTYYPVTIASGKVRTQRPFYYMIVGFDEVTNCISKIKIWHFECKKEGGKLYFRLSDNLSRISFHFYVQKIFIILILQFKNKNLQYTIYYWISSCLYSWDHVGAIIPWNAVPIAQDFIIHLILFTHVTIKI